MTSVFIRSFITGPRWIIEFNASTSSAAAVDKKLNGYVLNLGSET